MARFRSLAAGTCASLLGVRPWCMKTSTVGMIHGVHGCLLELEQSLGVTLMVSTCAIHCHPTDIVSSLHVAAGDGWSSPQLYGACGITWKHVLQQAFHRRRSLHAITARRRSYYCSSTVPAASWPPASDPPPTTKDTRLADSPVEISKRSTTTAYRSTSGHSNGICSLRKEEGGHRRIAPPSGRTKHTVADVDVDAHVAAALHRLPVYCT